MLKLARSHFCGDFLVARGRSSASAPVQLVAKRDQFLEVVLGQMERARSGERVAAGEDVKAHMKEPPLAGLTIGAGRYINAAGVRYCGAIGS